MVRHEARAGRLKWTYDDVKSLIQPYPRRKADSVFENVGDQHQMDEGEKPYEDDEAAVADSDTESNWPEWNEPAAAGTESTEDAAVAGSGGKQEETTAVAAARPLSAAAAEQLGGKPESGGGVQASYRWPEGMWSDGCCSTSG